MSGGDGDPWERHAQWWQDGFTDGADPEYVEQILPIVAAHLGGRQHVLDVGTGEGQLARHLIDAGVGRVTGIDPSVNQLRVATERAGGPTYARAAAAAIPFPDATFDGVVACLVFEHIEAVDEAIAEVARVLAPGGVFLFLLNHPLLQVPGSGWIDDHILEEQYWRIGPYLEESLDQEEIAPGVTLPFIHRPMSRYVNALSASGLLVHEMLEPAPPAGFLARAVEYAESASIPRLLVLRARNVTELPLRSGPGNADVPGMRRSARALLALGTLGAVFGLAKIHALTHVYDLSGSARVGWSLAYVGVLLVAAYSVGLPSLPRTRNKLLVAAAAAGLGATLMSVVTLVAGGQLLPRFVIFGAAAVLTPWYVICASVAEGGRQRAEARDRIIVVGDADEGALVRVELEAQPERPAVLVGEFDIGEMIGAGHGLPLVDAAEGARCSVVVLSRRASEQESILDQAAALHRRGIRVRTLVGFYVEWLGKLPIGELERASMLFDIGEIHGRRYGRVKRLADVALGLAGCVALALAIPCVAVANRFGNRGPLFFRQARVGRDGHNFTMWKFRTMTDGPSRVWTAADDDRVTPFGRMLRRTHLDELPQAVNILRGDLSVVGPRPEQPHYVEELTDKIPFYDLRHVVRPGLTGWAQVKFGYAGDERDALEKLQYDFFYLQRQTLGLDVRIVARTFRETFGGRGR